MPVPFIRSQSGVSADVRPQCGDVSAIHPFVRETNPLARKKIDFFTADFLDRLKMIDASLTDGRISGMEAIERWTDVIDVMRESAKTQEKWPLHEKWVQCQLNIRVRDLIFNARQFCYLEPDDFVESFHYMHGLFNYVYRQHKLFSPEYINAAYVDECSKMKIAELLTKRLQACPDAEAPEACVDSVHRDATRLKIPVEENDLQISKILGWVSSGTRAFNRQDFKAAGDFLKKSAEGLNAIRSQIPGEVYTILEKRIHSLTRKLEPYVPVPSGQAI